MFQVQNSTYDQMSDELIHWWKIHGRSFPWRETRDPYMILLAEIMLHRTKASQVKGIFNEFARRYKDLEALYNAKYSDIISILKPLGLTWRSKLIVDLAEEIKRAYGGKIPESKLDLMSLPGVGDYVASAVRCFAFELPEVVLDTNTSRIVSRLFDLEIKGEMRRKKAVREAYQLILDKSRPREFNYALLDLAAAVCTPGSKRCSICPVSTFCKTARREAIP